MLKDFYVKRRFSLILILIAVVVFVINGAVFDCKNEKYAEKDIFTTNEQILVKIKNELPTKLNIVRFSLNISTTSEKTNSFYGEDESEFNAESVPENFEGFIGSLPDSVVDSLPDGAFSNDSEELGAAAKEMSGPIYLMSIVFEAFGSSIGSVLPMLATLFAIVLLSALCHLLASGTSLSGAVSFAVKLCSFSAISATAISSLTRLESYFSSLFSAVAAFVPVSGVLMAMGGNVSEAASGSMGTSITLAVCEFFCTKTVIPVFCFCLSLSFLLVFDGGGSFVGKNISATVKKWYMTVFGFVMMILTVSAVTRNVISSKADTLLMKSAKYAVGAFVPITGGAVSGTLGTLSASVELLRGSVGVVGIIVILMMLLPVIIELALVRAAFGLSAFAAGALSCPGEHSLLSGIGELYSYLEGVAAISAAVFIIAFAVFATTAGAVG